MAGPVAAVSTRELVLGRYRPLRPLGSGGSGSVWLARDEGSGLEVALKVVRREGKAEARAEREASVAARLRHERCLRAYGYGRDDRHAYIAYEYAPGRTLREAIRSGSVDDGSAVEIAVQVLEGLAHAHARGVVHRDVKPSNVLLVDGDEVSVRVLDFGLARVDDADTLTASGDVPGTLAYIAPERLAGGACAPAADVWAVGVILWEALAGVHPFWTASLLGTARAIESGAPSLATARPDLPRHLIAAVDRALSVDPARRPSAEKLARVLRGAFSQRETRGGGAISVPALPRSDRLAPAALAGLVAGWGASALPFYPAGWWLGLGALAAAATLVRERAGLAIALAVPILPLGNFALAAAVVYAAAALAWIVLAWREPRGGLLFAVGPLIAPLGALGLAPLATLTLRAPVRRAATAGTAVLTAALVAAVGGDRLPLTGEAPPALPGTEGSEHPLAVTRTLGDALLARPGLLVAGIALAAAAAFLPLARARGPWWIAGLGAGLLAATLLAAPELSAAPLVAAVWITCAVLALTAQR